MLEMVFYIKCNCFYFPDIFLLKIISKRTHKGLWIVIVIDHHRADIYLKLLKHQ